MYRRNPSAEIRDQLKFALELHRLVDDPGKQSLSSFPVPDPTGKDLFAETKAKEVRTEPGSTYELWQRLVREAQIVTSPREDQYYGLTLRNESEVPLYFFVIYFNPSDCSIDVRPPEFGTELWRRLTPRTFCAAMVSPQEQRRYDARESWVLTRYRSHLA